MAPSKQEGAYWVNGHLHPFPEYIVILAPLVRKSLFIKYEAAKVEYHHQLLFVE